MREAIQTFRRALQRYTPLKEELGVDEDGEVKVYNLIAKSKSSPPYIVTNYPPGSGIEGAYGEDIVIENMGIQVTSWATELERALKVADMADDAILDSDFNVSPFEVKSLRRISNPLPMVDTDAQLVGVVVRYEAMLAL